MRLGVIPETLLEWLALKLHRVPSPVAEGVFAMMLSRAVMAGVRLGVFSALEQGSLTLDTLAERLNSDRTGVEALSEALVASGYLVRRGDRLANGQEASRWLTPSSPHYLGNLIQFNYDHWEWWSRLEECVLLGRPVDIHRISQGPAELRRYVLAMRDLAWLSMPEVLAALPVPPGAKRLLDVGGSHGAYSVALCRRHPGLSATVVELDPVAQIGRVLVAEEGLGQRIQYRSADATKDDLGEGYDLALLFQLLHHFPEGMAAHLVGRVAATLKPGGVIALLEPSRDSPQSQMAGLLHLHYFLSSLGGVYGRAPMERWLRECGCARIAATYLRSAPGLLLLAATREG